MSADASPIGQSLALPRISPAMEPAFVREGSPATKHAYEEGLGFEEMLTEQLGKALTEGGALGEGGQAEGGLGGEEEESAFGAGDSLVSSMLPRALSEGIVSGGGLGIAAQLAHEISGGGRS